MKLDRQDQLDDRYEHFVDEIAERHASEYEADYGPAFRAKHPYKPDHARIRREALARCAEIEAQD